jgi:hypothetical protein
VDDHPGGRECDTSIEGSVMARVFLSYRRADGRYAVGWIAERLRRLDEVTEVSTAFGDGELRCGDDFPAALAKEIDNCDVLVAVIGPNWLGRRAEGDHRIRDPADWVGREIATALASGKRVLPVLVGGAEPLVASDLSESLQPLVNLHTVSFVDGNDLEDLVEHLRSHLGEIDRERAMAAGLDAPIVLPGLRFGAVISALALLAGAGGAALGWGITTAAVTPPIDPRGAIDPTETSRFLTSSDPWTIIGSVEIGLWAALAVLGWHYFWHHLRGDVRINWRPVLLTLAFGSVLLAWTIVAFGASAPIRFDEERTWLLAILPPILLAPWIITATGTAWTTTTVNQHELGRRSLVLGELSRANRVSVAVLGLAMAPGVLAAGAIAHALERCECGDAYEARELLAFGAFLSAALVGLTVWGRSRLRQSSIELESDLRALAPDHRRHAEQHLIDDSLGLGVWWQIAVLLVPLLTAIAVIIRV